MHTDRSRSLRPLMPEGGEQRRRCPENLFVLPTPGLCQILLHHGSSVLRGRALLEQLDIHLAGLALDERRQGAGAVFHSLRSACSAVGLSPSRLDP